MITVITDREQIAKLHRRFHKRLSNFLTDDIDCWVGYPSGSFEDTVKYSDELDIWISHNEQHNRFWNGFGVGRPRARRNNSLNGEINFPFEGIKRNIAGAFAQEDNGNILVLHRGRIGGGKPGIGKNYFKDNYRGDFETVIDDDRETEFCLVGELNSKYFPKQVANFIKEIYRVKHIEEGKISPDFEDLYNFNFTDEHSGRIETDRTRTTVIDRTHGIVVNALATELENRKYKIGNDRNRDLFIHRDNKIATLFEIKTSTSTQNLYSAVGQLIIYSIPIKNEVKLVIVIPKRLNKTVTKRLSQLGIQILYYEWTNDTPTFIGLEDILE
ncbi:MAG: hypothetical protein Q8N38_05315 [Bacteroidales bacterium]|nr:hypothetical protein [Bacteroidales bacterium]